MGSSHPQVCKEEKEAGQLHVPITSAVERAAMYLGVSQSTLYRMQRNGFEAVEKRRPSKQMEMDDFDKDVIRRTIHDLILHQRIVPNVRILLKELRERIGYTGQRESLRKTLHKLGFHWKKTQNNRSILMERTDVVAKRIQYLRKTKDYRDKGRTIVFTDETYVHSTHTVPRSWQSDDMALKVPFGKGERFIVVHAGTKDGFIDGASLVFKSKTTSGDYHHEMNSENFMKWLREKLIPNLPPRSVIVIDNAPYHNIQIDKCPTTANRKADIQAWLSRKGVAFTPKMLKAELLELCKTHRSTEPQYVMDSLFQDHGHDCVRLPPYHADLNAIEMIWARVKGNVAQRNVTFKSSETTNLIEESLKSITSEFWMSCCRHVEELEAKYRSTDIAVEEEMEKLIITVTSSDEGTDTASSTDDGSETDTTEEL